jgi:hypothetical protein
MAIGCGGSTPEVKEPTDVKPDETPKWESADSTPTTTPTAAKITDPSARRSDLYDKEATEIGLRRAERQVKENCGQAKDDTGKAVGPWGKVTVKVMLGHNGHSKTVTVPPPFEGKVTGNCVVKAFTNLTFPPWAGADTEVPWDVEVVSPTPEPKK